MAKIHPYMINSHIQSTGCRAAYATNLDHTNNIHMLWVCQSAAFVGIACLGNILGWDLLRHSQCSRSQATHSVWQLLMQTSA